MPSDHPKSNDPEPRVTLALRAREAAKALGISPRLLATLVAQKRIPFIRINSMPLFPVRELQEWLTSQIGKEGKP